MKYKLVLEEPGGKLPYCYFFSRALNFAKMEQEYFAGLKFRDLAKKYV